MHALCNEISVLCNDTLALPRIIIEALGSKMLPKWGMLARAVIFARPPSNTMHRPVKPYPGVVQLQCPEKLAFH